MSTGDLLYAISSAGLTLAAGKAERRALWADFHAEQAEKLRRTSTELIAFHEARAAALCEESGHG